MRIVLHLERPDRAAGQMVAVQQSPFFIGRADDADLRAQHPAVSRRHCVLMDSGGRPLVRDLGSRNGTHVNGERVRGDRELRDGDRLEAGPLQLTVHVPLESVARKSDPTGRAHRARNRV